MGDALKEANGLYTSGVTINHAISVKVVDSLVFD